eukprot:10163941-Alexandrium_andersonii.AAC.1
MRGSGPSVGNATGCPRPTLSVSLPAGRRSAIPTWRTFPPAPWPRGRALLPDQAGTGALAANVSRRLNQ